MAGRRWLLRIAARAERGSKYRRQQISDALAGGLVVITRFFHFAPFLLVCSHGVIETDLGHPAGTGLESLKDTRVTGERRVSGLHASRTRHHGFRLFDYVYLRAERVEVTTSICRKPK